LHFKEILSRVTGFSVPIFGIQWNPPVPEVRVARELMRELEDRRVLYSPVEMEGAQHCVTSIFELRRALTESTKMLDTSSNLYKQVQRIRRACRVFCDFVGSTAFSTAPIPIQISILNQELGKLRQVTGKAVGEICIAYGLDVEDELASVIPYNNVF